MTSGDDRGGAWSRWWSLWGTASGIIALDVWMLLMEGIPADAGEAQQSTAEDRVERSSW